MTYLEVLVEAAQYERPIFALSVKPKKGSKSKGNKRHWLCAEHLKRKHYGRASIPHHLATDDFIVRTWCAVNRIVGVNNAGHVRCRNCRTWQS